MRLKAAYYGARQIKAVWFGTRRVLLVLRIYADAAGAILLMDDATGRASASQHETAIGNADTDGEGSLAADPTAFAAGRGEMLLTSCAIMWMQLPARGEARVLLLGRGTVQSDDADAGASAEQMIMTVRADAYAADPATPETELIRIGTDGAARIPDSDAAHTGVERILVLQIADAFAAAHAPCGVGLIVLPERAATAAAPDSEATKGGGGILQRGSADGVTPGSAPAGASGETATGSDDSTGTAAQPVSSGSDGQGGVSFGAQGSALSAQNRTAFGLGCILLGGAAASVCWCDPIQTGSRVYVRSVADPIQSGSRLYIGQETD